MQECKMPIDCEASLTCFQGVCTTRADASVSDESESGVAEASAEDAADAATDGTPDAPNDAPASTDEGTPDASNEVSAGGGCLAPCATFDACRGGNCYQGGKVGPYGLADTSVHLPTSESIFCVQLDISTCGDLTGIGFALKTAVNANVRFAVYDGNSNVKLTQTNNLSINGTTEDAIVDPIVRVGCESLPHPYWMCVASSSPALEFEAISNSTTNWSQTLASPQLIAGWISSGLPDPRSQSPITSTLTPRVYMWIVPSH
jgi:hypothetical protein